MPKKRYDIQAVEEVPTQIPPTADAVVYQDGNDVIVWVKDERWNDLGLLIESWIPDEVKSWEKIPAQRKFIFHPKNASEMGLKILTDWGSGDHYES